MHLCEYVQKCLNFGRWTKNTGQQNENYNSCRVRYYRYNSLTDIIVIAVNYLEVTISKQTLIYVIVKNQ